MQLTQPASIPPIPSYDNKTSPATATSKQEATPPEPQPTPSQDQLRLDKPLPSASQAIAPEIKLFETPTNKSDKNPWHVKSVHLNMGYVLDNQVIHTGPMHISNPATGTDVTIRGYQQIDRKNWEYLDFDGRFAPDEPQFNLGVNMTFENNFGLELDGKHNKIIMNGYDQPVHFKGTINGQEVDGVAPLNSFMEQHEQTFGNMQISTLGTYTFDLPAPANHKFSFITKAGPSLVTANSRARFKGPDGNFDGGTSSLKVAGYGGILENGLRYQFGPKTGRLGLELTHSLSALNYASYEMPGGYHGKHTAVYNSFALKATVGLHGNKKPSKPPADF